jgi:circadian clock protein KaiA
LSHPSPLSISPLLIYACLKSDQLVQAVQQKCNPDRHQIHFLASNEAFLEAIEQKKQELDCLVLQTTAQISTLTRWLHGRGILLPAVIVVPPSEPPSSFSYHTAEVHVTADQLDAIEEQIERAIAQFLDLSASCRLTPPSVPTDIRTDLSTQKFLLDQQSRLAEKLKERLGYMGVYYKRSSRNFLRNLPPDQQQEVLEALQTEYRNIVLRYFVDDDTLNQRIDDLVNIAFFADVSVAQIVEIHMELMDEFSKQLKLEGRSEEILLDYRLTLIDTIAHLCEMYRRSIPRES